METRKSRRGAFPTLPKRRTVNVTSLAAGQASPPVKRNVPSVVNSGTRTPQVKSLGTGTIRANNTRVSINVSMDSSSLALSSKPGLLDNFSGCSITSADSFVNVLESFSSHDDDDEQLNDPYLARPRRRQAPQQQQYVVSDYFDEFVTSCPNTSCHPPEEPDFASAISTKFKSTSLMSNSFPSTALRIPSIVRRTQESSPNVLLDDDKSEAQVTLTKIKQKEQTYWNTVLAARKMTHGIVHRKTAEAFMYLGNSHMRGGDCPQAIKAFESACKIYEILDGPHNLSVAGSLDSIGLAALRSRKSTHTLHNAKEVLGEAFAIRFALLGPWHVDTVETYNKIASVHLHLQEFREAAKAYEEVHSVRAAIFGDNHPSVAIAAHSLANVYLKLMQHDLSYRYYNVALDIYKRMQLPTDHPTVARLLRDRKRLERVCMS
jgi:tetratricopeptide (TPR) repeat protein